MLEPYDGKPSRTVLRGGSGSNAALLPDRPNVWGRNAAGQGLSRIDRGNLSVLLTVHIAWEATADPLRRFPRWRAGGASLARIARRGGKRRLPYRQFRGV